MAIVKMKKLRVVAMAEQKDALLEGLMRLGCVEISAPDAALSDPALAALLERGTSRLTETRTSLADARAALAAIKRYGKAKDGLFIRRSPVSLKEFSGGERLEQGAAACRHINEALQVISRVQAEEERLLSARASLLPWQSLDLPLEMGGTDHTLFRLGVCPGSTDTGAVRNALGGADAAAELYEISGDRQQKYLLAVFHREDEEKVQDTLRPFNFSAVAFPNLTGTAKENLRRLDELLAENRARREGAERAIRESASQQDALRLYADHLAARETEDGGAERLLTDGTILYFEGWAPAEKEAAVGAFLDSLDCAWETADPREEEYPEVPVQLKNNAVTRPLNMVTEMYSLPAYDNVDPNPLMAPFFILFYGIMLADMGYGLLMIAAGLYVTRKYHPKGTMGHMFGLATLCGISTFFMGALTGGFFGDFLTQLVKLTTGGDFALPALFTPLNDTLMILIGAMVLGLIQIITGMAISFIRKIRRGRILDAVWEEGTWWTVFLGIALMALGITNWVLYLGLVMIVVGSGWNARGFGKVTAIFGSLYNHITGYFGDILSYSRLMALMLAGSVIAQVFNTLGAIPGNVVVFVIISMAGNALNFALNLLGCYVHDLRLQCLEYFGKFYEDGGKPFRPLAANTKYVDIQDS